MRESWRVNVINLFSLFSLSALSQWKVKNYYLPLGVVSISIKVITPSREGRASRAMILVTFLRLKRLVSELKQLETSDLA
jgi:hypothetical protein